MKGSAVGAYFFRHWRNGVGETGHVFAEFYAFPCRQGV